MRAKTMNSIARQSGSTLLIAVVLLLLAGVMTVLAMNVGIFEQRSTANDVRAKAVHEVAEAGLAQGAEYLLRQHPEMFTTFTTFPNTATAQWTPCTDTSFPCGAVAATDGAGNPRRSTMYRLNSGGISSGTPFAEFGAVMAARMLPLSDTIANVGSGFPVAYGVAPVMCFVAKRVANEPVNSPIRCATTEDEASGHRIVTFVSVASIVGENARTTLTQSVGRYPLLSAPLGQPPIIAAGTVNLVGGGQVVTNPNGGGTGVPVSIWARKDINKSGTPNTCYADEFFRFGAKNNAPPTFEGVNVKAIVCDTCQCVGNESLSYDKSGNVQDEGIDILDVETGTSSADRGTGVNYNVRSDSLSYPTCEFPPDLFAHLFGIAAWRDDDHDCFGEVKIMRDFTNPNPGGGEVTMGADEAFLYENAVQIVGSSGAPAALATDAQKAGPTYPSAAVSGLVWCQASCDTSPSDTLGSPDHPIVLVVDGAVSMKGRIFGIVFVRTKSGGLTLTNPSGYTMSPGEILTGGNADITLNANTAIYGSLVVQGKFDKFNGTAAVIYSEAVLKAIGQDPNNNQFGTLPGAWNDRSTY